MLQSKRPFDKDVVAQIDEQLRGLPDGYASVELVQGLLDVQQLLLLHSSHGQSVPAGLKAVRWARQLGDRSLLAKALTYRGGAAIENHEPSVGLEATVDALRIGLEDDDAFRVTTCYINVTVLMRRLGRYRAALACSAAARQWSCKLSAQHAFLRAMVMNLSADLYLTQRAWRAALDAAREAQTLFQYQTLIRSSIDMNAQYASAIQNEVSALIQLADFVGARAAIERLTLAAKQYPSERSDSYLRFALAMYEGFTRPDVAAAENLRNFQHLVMRDEAVQYVIDIYERAGETDKALKATRELLESLRSTRREVTAADLLQIDISSSDEDDGIVRELISRAAHFEHHVHTVADKFNAKLAYLFELGVSAELREEDGAFAGEHIYRVGRLCAALALEAEYGEEMCWLSEIAGRLHDVGKAGLPSHVVLKTGPLSDGEKEIIRLHSEDGAALVVQLSEPRLVQVVAAVRHHHERWDGEGYPSRLKGEEIPLLARIAAICESFDAMTHARLFRSARSVANGLQEIERCAGSQFEPRLAGLFVNLVRRLYRDHGDLDEYLGETGRRTRWAKSHPELMRILEEPRRTL